MFHSILQDLRLAVRQLRKTPAFTLTAVLTLALGIAATTAMFTVVNAVMLRPLPLPEQDRLVWMGMKNIQAPSIFYELDYQDFFDWRAQAKSFTAIASFYSDPRTLTGFGDPRHVTAEVVSSDFFNVLGIKPSLGRGFIRDDEKAGTHTAVLSHQVWRELFHSSPDAIGKTINMSGNAYEVIGVAPEGFAFPFDDPSPAVWVSLADDSFDPGGHPLVNSRGAHLLSVIARLKPGVTLAQARSEVDTIAHSLSLQYPRSNSQYIGANLSTALDQIVGDSSQPLRLLFAAVCFLLFIMCLNVAGLMLARGSRRSSDIAVRAALGARRGQIVRQVLVESILLSICGGLLGIALASLILRSLLTMLPANMPRLHQISMDARVALFAVGVSLFCGVLFGVLPALRISKLQPAAVLRTSARTTTGDRSHHRLQTVLVVAETALGLVLLTASGLMVRSLVHLFNVDPGFEANGVLTMRLDLSYPKPEQSARFYEQLMPRLAALPGVRSAGASMPVPLQIRGFSSSFEIAGQTYAPGTQPGGFIAFVVPRYFETMHIPLIKGRTFTDADTADSQRVIVVNQAFADKFFPGEDAVGKNITPGVDSGKTVPGVIVGVVGNAKRERLSESDQPQYYMAYSQTPLFSPTLVLRTDSDPATLVSAVREQVAQIDRNVPVFDPRKMEDYLSKSSATPRFQTTLLTIFAAMSLLLSAIGLYSLLAYMVAQRTAEMGVRIALGAQRSTILKLVLRRGLTLAFIGLALGILLSVAGGRLLRDMLYGVTPFDMPTMVVVSAVLLLVSVLASFAPALRASRLDPIRTLREQ